MPPPPRRSEPLLQAYRPLRDQNDKGQKRKRSVESSGPAHAGDHQRPHKVRKCEPKRPEKLETFKVSPSVERQSQNEMVQKLAQVTTREINNLRDISKGAAKDWKRLRRDLDLTQRRDIAGLGRQDEMRKAARKTQNTVEKLENLSTTTQEGLRKIQDKVEKLENLSTANQEDLRKSNTNITAISKRLDDDFVSKQMLDIKLKECREQMRGDFQRILEEREKEFIAQREARTAKAGGELYDRLDALIQELEAARKDSEGKILGLETQNDSNRDEHDFPQEERIAVVDTVDVQADRLEKMDEQSDTFGSFDTRLSNVEDFINGFSGRISVARSAIRSQSDANLLTKDTAKNASSIANSGSSLRQKIDDSFAQVTELQQTNGKVEGLSRQFRAMRKFANGVQVSHARNFQYIQNRLVGLQNAMKALATKQDYDKHGSNITVLQTKMDAIERGLVDASEGGNDCDPVRIDSFERVVKQIRRDIHQLKDSDALQWRQIGSLAEQLVPSPHASDQVQQDMTQQQPVSRQLPSINGLDGQMLQQHRMQSSRPQSPPNGQQRGGSHFAASPQSATPIFSEGMRQEYLRAAHGHPRALAYPTSQYVMSQLRSAHTEPPSRQQGPVLGDSSPHTPHIVVGAHRPDPTRHGTPRYARLSQPAAVAAPHAPPDQTQGTIQHQTIQGQHSSSSGGGPRTVQSFILELPPPNQGPHAPGHGPQNESSGPPFH